MSEDTTGKTPETLQVGSITFSGGADSVSAEVLLNELSVKYMVLYEKYQELVEENAALKETK